MADSFFDGRRQPRQREGAASSPIRSRGFWNGARLRRRDGRSPSCARARSSACTSGSAAPTKTRCPPEVKRRDPKLDIAQGVGRRSTSARSTTVVALRGERGAGGVRAASARRAPPWSCRATTRPRPRSRFEQPVAHASRRGAIASSCRSRAGGTWWSATRRAQMRKRPGDNHTRASPPRVTGLPLLRERLERQEPFRFRGTDRSRDTNELLKQARAADHRRGGHRLARPLRPDRALRLLRRPPREPPAPRHPHPLRDDDADRLVAGAAPERAHRLPPRHLPQPARGHASSTTTSIGSRSSTPARRRSPSASQAFRTFNIQPKTDQVVFATIDAGASETGCVFGILRRRQARRAARRQRSDDRVPRAALDPWLGGERLLHRLAYRSTWPTPTTMREAHDPFERPRGGGGLRGASAELLVPSPEARANVQILKDAMRPLLEGERRRRRAVSGSVRLSGSTASAASSTSTSIGLRS